MAWYEKDKYKECCHNDGCESFDTCIECWDEWAERNPPITNADHIRAMSDEELCEFLSQYSPFKMCDEGCDACSYKGDCDKRLLEWLNQPYKENKE